MANEAYGGGLGSNWEYINLNTPLDPAAIAEAFKTAVTSSAPEKDLKVTVHYGRNLAAADPNGKSDPYVKFGILANNKLILSHKTKPISSTLNPNWTSKHKNEATWTIKKENSSTFVLEVWDKDLIGSDDFLGVASFPLVYGETIKNKDIDLDTGNRKVKRKITGSINISLEWQ